MPPKKVSAIEERADKVYTFLHESAEPYTIKILEKKSKDIGVYAMQLKDMLKRLMDDDKIIGEKLGSSVWYWSFPSTTSQAAKVDNERATKKLSVIQKEVDALRKEKEELQIGREDTPQRKMLIAQYKELKSKQKELSSKIAWLRKNDPQAIAKKRRCFADVIRGVNQWTDATYSLKSYIVKNYPSIEEPELKKHLGIDDSFDYIEEE
ncbi:Meiotic nuclear division protein 1 like protein [Aduncisulcus paluster]|uniref:Meiotic nuclear division protein 1 like protein n=1 Tax=Aduncisulcus paluster TaxID=2918883 RepID=A0ABQ5JZP9_9EUKA|nr:Meiotic nuclear division protein 1 like protein [Aduncisulcus paluster]